MRKNTLIKLLAVLVMCFLVGAALVSCGEGETEETVKTVVGVQFVGDDLVITYSDGTKTTTAIPAAAECKHEGANQYSLVDHGVRSENDADFAEKGKFVNGVILNVCNDCCSAWTEDGVLHVGYATETIPATCVAKACVARICEIPGCGERFDKKEVGEVGGHVYKVTSDVNYCVGGTKIETCDNCTETTEGHTRETVIPAAEALEFVGVHRITNWSKIDANDTEKDAKYVNPTNSNAGYVKGICDECGETCYYDVKEIPSKKDGNGYDFDEINSDMLTECGDGANYIYTHTVTGLVYTFSVAKAENPEAVVHQLGGKSLVSANQIDKGEEFEKAYYIEELPKGVITYGNQPVKCYEASLAYFHCTAVHDDGTTPCNKVITIYVKAKHAIAENAVWTDVVGEVANCENGGRKQTSCANDGCPVTQYKDAPPLNHKWVAVDEGLYFEDGSVFNPSDYSNIDKKPYHKYKCTNANCTVEGGKIEYRLVNDYAVDKETDPATCQWNGTGMISWTKCDKTKGSATVVLPQFDHKVKIGEEYVVIKASNHAEYSDYIYYADDPVYGPLIVVAYNDLVKYEAGEKVEGSIVCSCDCKGCDTHAVTIWVKKTGYVAPANED